MKYLLTVIGLIFSIPVMSAEDTDYSSMLRDKGHTQCSGAINTVANWILDQDGRALSIWNKGNPNKHTAALVGTKRYTDGQRVVHITATPTISGGCDLAFTVVTPLNISCTKLRETLLKDWKYFGDLAGLPIYEDPTSSNVNVVMQPNGEGCLHIKTGVIFYAKEDLQPTPAPKK